VESFPTEINPAANPYTPFQHQRFYKGERELLGYNPRYFPGNFAFDELNRPYTRTPDGTIQTLDAENQWRKLDFKPAIKAAFPDWDGRLDTGPFAAEEITFDQTGALYSMVVLSPKSPWKKTVLVYSPDHGNTWQVYPLPPKFNSYHSKMEVVSPNRRTSQPPGITIFNDNDLYLLLPEKTQTGLNLPDPHLISQSATMVPTHSGGGNISITAAGQTFVVYAGKIQPPGTQGTPQYIIVFNHFSKACSPPVYLGSNGHGKVDNHNLPALEIDSKGYLHILLGSHHDPFQYIHSLQPYNISLLSSPEVLGYPKTKMGEGSYTYIGILADKFDNLHVTARWAGNGYKNFLIYMKKPFGHDWLPQKILVEPFKTLYSVYYHKMAQDSLGRLFINYFYYGNELTAEQFAAYQAKYGGQELVPPKNLSEFPNGLWLDQGLTYHDPVCIVSNDSGDTFRLALTPDFTCGAIGQQSAGATVENSIGMSLVEIPAGSFVMGSLTANRYDEKPLRPTTISQKFQIGQHPVRVKDFARFVDTTGYKTEFERHPAEQLHNWCGGKFLSGDNRNWRNPGIPQTPDDPVVLITPGDANAFCQWLSKQEKTTYRLPTEAEWEYACRANSTTNYYFGDSAEYLPRYAWYRANAERTKPVGQLLPNAWGLYDMAGNVWEYCADYYLPQKSDFPAENPLQSAKKEMGTVIRGGSWIDDWGGDYNGANLRSSARYHIPYPLIQLDWVGFRVVKTVD
jgi:formylglycine-generating enzyme required for sulfatase activity